MRHARNAIEEALANRIADGLDIPQKPGMPTTVMIQRVERTALDYLVGPLVLSFNRAFRQK